MFSKLDFYRKRKLTKLSLFLLIIFSMIFYVGWVFYISEPKYINNLQAKELENYDYVSVPSKSYYKYDAEMTNGIIVQVDDKKALLLVKDGRALFNNTEFYELEIEKHNYRIIGKGTVYHKVNSYVGFNIFLITQFVIITLLLILSHSTYFLLISLLQDFDVL